MTRPILVWPTLILIGTGLTLATVLVTNWAGGYGFPVAWKNGGCPPSGIVFTSSCLIAIGYDWLGFMLDVLLFTVLGYGLLLVRDKYRDGGMPRVRRN